MTFAETHTLCSCVSLYTSRGLNPKGLNPKSLNPKSPKAKEMLQRTNGARTIPQIFIGDHYIGGNDELQAANRNGELDKLLA